MQQIERFAFDRIFVPGASRPPPVQPGTPTGYASLELSALKAEVETLRAQQADLVAVSRIEGFEAGLAQARGERETAVLSAVDALQGGLEALDGDYAELERRLIADATTLALAVADMLAARALDLAPTAAINAALGRVLDQVARGTELQLRVHPAMVETIEAHIAERQAQDRRKLRIVLVPDDTLAIGDGRIVWDQGGVTIDGAARRAQVQSEVAMLLGI